MCIARDIARNRGLLCYYTQWLEDMMGKFDLPQDYRARHSLIAIDSQGKHIGCSGGMKNTLAYYNPDPSGLGQGGEVQFQEAVRKNLLSEKLRGVPQHKRSSGRQIRVDSTKQTANQSQPCFGSGIVQSSDISRDVDIMSDGDTDVQQDHETGCQALGPQYIGKDGVVHVVKELRPQSADSYYARIDEAFRKHRANISKPAGDIGGLEKEGGHECPEDCGITESRAYPDSRHAIEPGNKETVAKSKFCTIL